MSVLEMGEHEGGFRDVADAALTDGDVPQDASSWSAAHRAVAARHRPALRSW
jgi:hypothetical protein